MHRTMEEEDQPVPFFHIESAKSKSKQMEDLNNFKVYNDRQMDGGIRPHSLISDTRV